MWYRKNKSNEKNQMANGKCCRLTQVCLRVVVRLGPLKFYVMECSDFLFKARLWLINVVEKDFTPIS